MVCQKCEAKLGKLVTQDKWKSGSRNSNESGGRVGQNKLLGNKTRFAPYKDTQFEKCRICKSKVHQLGSKYCQGCAYKKGICAMCGIKILATKNYNQSCV